MDRKKTKDIKRKSFLILVYCFEFAIFPFFFDNLKKTLYFSFVIRKRHKVELPLRKLFQLLSHLL